MSYHVSGVADDGGGDGGDVRGGDEDGQLPMLLNSLVFVLLGRHDSQHGDPQHNNKIMRRSAQQHLA
jgi:hypothetical protein